MQLSTHFSLEELTFSSTAVRAGIDNTPSHAIISTLIDLAVTLEAIRALLGFPMHIDSGYRCETLNSILPGSSPDSAHIQGYAADFLCPQYGVPITIVRAIAASSIKFDELIQEGTWVHISIDQQMRREILTAHFHPSQKPFYTHGV
jgi:uncharacterized protein YcbK (DUF882 family)